MQSLRQNRVEREELLLVLESMILIGIVICLFLLLLTPLLVTVGTIFPFIVGKALASRSLIALMFGLWTALAFLLPKYRPQKSWILIAFGIWLLVTVLSGITGVSFQRSLWSTYERMQGIIDLAHWLVLTVILSSIVRPGLERFHFTAELSSKSSKSRSVQRGFDLGNYISSSMRSLLSWQVLLNFNLAVALLVALIGLNLHYNWDVKALQIYDELSASSRMASTLGNATYVGAYMLVNAFISCAFLAQSLIPQSISNSEMASLNRRRRIRSKKPRKLNLWVICLQIFWASVMGLGLWSLVLSETRGSIFVGLPIGVLVFCSTYLLFGKLRRVKMACLLMFGVMTVAVTTVGAVRSTNTFDNIADSNRIVSRLRDINLEEASIKGRIAAHEAGIDGFMAKPLLGWGPENYAIPFGRFFDYDPDVTLMFDQAHNKVLEEMTTKGSLGFISYMALWMSIIWVLYRKIANQEDKQQIFNLFIGAALASYFFQNLFLFDTPATVLQFALLVAFVSSLEQRNQSVVGDNDGRGIIKIAFRKSNNLLTTKPLKLLLLLVPLIVGLAIALNVRIYHAASVVVQAESPQLTWTQRLAVFQESIDSFEPLANYPRIFLIGQVIPNMDRMSRKDLDMSMSMIQREAIRAIATEPEEWRIHADLARVYRAASLIDSKYKAQAEFYLERATELGPETLAVMALKAAAETD